MPRFSDFEGRPNSNAPHAGPVAVGAIAQTLSALVVLHADTKFVLVKVESAPLRLTPDGTEPTAALGFSYPIAAEILLSRNEADAAKLIRDGAVNSAIQVAQFTA